MAKSIKKYSIDLSMFSSSDSQQDPDFDFSSRETRKMRKMTFDSFQCTERARNPIEKDPAFQKMNQDGVIINIDLDNLI